MTSFGPELHHQILFPTKETNHNCQSYLKRNFENHLGAGIVAYDRIFLAQQMFFIRSFLFPLPRFHLNSALLKLWWEYSGGGFQEADEAIHAPPGKVWGAGQRSTTSCMNSWPAQSYGLSQQISHWKKQKINQTFPKVNLRRSLKFSASRQENWCSCDGFFFSEAKKAIYWLPRILWLWRR